MLVFHCFNEKLLFPFHNNNNNLYNLQIRKGVAYGMAVYSQLASLFYVHWEATHLHEQVWQNKLTPLTEKTPMASREAMCF